MTQTITDPTEIAEFITTHAPPAEAQKFAADVARIELIPINEPLPCPVFCDGDCADWQVEDGGYHASGFTLVDAYNFGRKDDVEMSISVVREDKEGVLGQPEIHLITGDLGGEDLVLTATRARRFAVLLLNAAGTADPTPSGVLLMTASALRLDDELLTDDGWQKVIGLMFFDDSGQASVFTAERDPEDSDGWPFDLADPVKVRRAVDAR